MMKKLFVLGSVLFGSLSVMAQLNPVTWTFSAVKTSDKNYEIHMKATIQQNWHVFSQAQPEDAIANPTTFVISPNPLFKTEGKITEVGKLEKVKEGDFSSHQYSSTVEFVQKIKMKGNVKTNFSGTVEYQTCDDKRCLPPKKVNFSVAIK